MYKLAMYKLATHAGVSECAAWVANLYIQEKSKNIRYLKKTDVLMKKTHL